jgi:hypothetical protein
LRQETVSCVFRPEEAEQWRWGGSNQHKRSITFEPSLHQDGFVNRHGAKRFHCSTSWKKPRSNINKL